MLGANNGINMHKATLPANLTAPTPQGETPRLAALLQKQYPNIMNPYKSTNDGQQYFWNLNHPQVDMPEWEKVLALGQQAAKNQNSSVYGRMSDNNGVTGDVPSFLESIYGEL